MITVLRLGHRVKRDARISTHCGLVARAFGASGIIFSGERDENLIKGLKEVTKRWGGPFSVRYEKNYRKIIKSYRRHCIIHLTMYGIPINKEIKQLKRKRNILLIIGGEKVPGEIYTLSNYNIAVTNQPHSEVAALAVFLNEYSCKKKFNKARIRIIPQKKGKRVVD